MLGTQSTQQVNTMASVYSQNAKPNEKVVKEEEPSIFEKVSRLFACALTRTAANLQKTTTDAEAAAADAKRLISEGRREILELERTCAAEKSKLISMKRGGADMAKLKSAFQRVKRYEVRIAQKQKLIMNMEATADSASDAHLVIETARLQKSMVGLQKQTMKDAFDGTDVEDLVDEIQDHQEDVHEISETLSSMHLGTSMGRAAAVSDAEFQEWLDDADSMDHVDLHADAMPAVPGSWEEDEGVVAATAAAKTTALRSRKVHTERKAAVVL